MFKKFIQQALSLFEFIIAILKKGTDDQIAAFAAQSAFFILMSVFPFAIFLLQMMRFAPISQETLLFSVDSVFPEYLLPTLHEILQEIYSSSASLVTITVITTLWASSNAMYAVGMALNRICNAQETRNNIVIRLWALVHTLCFAIVLVIAVASTVYWQTLRSFLVHYRPHGLSLSFYSSIIRGAYAMILLSIAFTLVYKIFPHQKLKLIDQIPGAIIASVGWYLSTVAISFYVTNFNAASMYGSLTTLALVMFWLYFCNYFLLIGAEINEVLRIARQSPT